MLLDIATHERLLVKNIFLNGARLLGLTATDLGMAWSSRPRSEPLSIK